MSVTFISSVRDGLASQLGAAGAPDGAGRVTLTVAATVAGEESREVSVRVLGPGDVTGIDARQVIRMDPPPGAQGTEPNMFVLVEFDRPDFLWLFTPFAPDAQSRLQPWIALAVVPVRDGIALEPPRGRGTLPVLAVDDVRELPPLEDAFAWAHAQIAGSATSAVAITDAVRRQPAATLSRLLCPRLLEPGTRYLACVVPTFAAGVQAGLGEEPTGGAAPAWTHPAEGEAPTGARVPVLHSWEFVTGAPGDFETLVRLLEGIEPPPGIGRRPLDVSAPGPPGLAAPSAELQFSGALRPASAITAPWTDAAARQALEDFVNLGAGPPPPAPPVVAPPLYGGRAAGAAVVPAEPNPRPAWLRELNLDPRHRGTAALGTRLVQERQEELMRAAWQQAGAIEEANRRLRLARMARRAGRALVNNRLARLSPGALVQVGGPVLDRLAVAAEGLSARTRLGGTLLPAAVTLPAFRRLTRPGAPLGRALGGPGFKGRLAAAFESGRAQPDRSVTGRAGGLVTVGSILGSVAAVRTGLRAGGGEVAVDGGEISPTRPGARPARVAVAAGAAGSRVTISDRDRMVGGGPVVLEDLSVPTLATLDRIGGSFADPSTIGGLPGTFQLDVEGVPVDLTSEARSSLEELLTEPLDPETPAFQPAALQLVSAEILSALDPRATIARAVAGTVTVPAELQGDDVLDDVLAAPLFPAPLAPELESLSGDLLLPGADGAPHETCFAVVTNPAFVQALLVGANHEMARELRWRGFPTDERGTCFHRFWDMRGTVPEGTEPQPDIRDVHRFAPSGRLGDEVGGGRQQVVLVVRSELFRRYPGTQVLAASAVATAGGRRPDFDAVELPRFRGRIGQDIYYFGFSFDAAQARGGQGAGEGRYAVFQQPPGAPRFGLDEADPAAPSPPWPASPSDLSWGHVARTATGYVDLLAPVAVAFADEPTVRWGESAAGQARATLQQPVRVAVHFSDLLGSP